MDGWRKKREVMLHYDQTAASYDAQYAEEQRAKIEVALSKVNLRGNSLILDVGCGTGLLFPHIADKAKLLIGLDLSRVLLKLAKKRAREFPNIFLVQADADHMPLKNEVFQALFAITLLQNMPNPETTLKEMERTTKPKSTMVLTTLKKKFAKEAISDLLQKTTLKVNSLKTTTETKDHIITCRKQRNPPVNFI